jgi:hypothetical protein
MITRRQAIFIGVWVGLPIVVFLVLFLVNPAYEQKLFEPFGPVYGTSVLALVEVLHGLVLYAGFWILNNGPSSATDEQRPKRNLPILLLMLLTLFTCTLPSLWLVILYPSMLMVLQTPP